MCTSGSTGVAKLVAIPQRMLREAWDRNAARNAMWGDIGGAVLVIPPLNTAAIRMGMLQAFSAGTCAILVDIARTSPDRVLALADEWDVRRFHLGPWLLRSLIDAATARQRGLATLRVIVSTGAPLTVDDVAGAWEWFPNARIRSHYGSTEVAGIANIDLAPGADLTDPDAMAAVIDLDARIRIMNDGRECAPGEQGDIWVASIHAHGVYRDAPDLESTTSARVEGALWVRTGDLGRLLADGRLMIDGRDDARVKVNGLAVDLNAVTTAVRSLPGVADAEVSAVPRGDDTQLVAWVVATDGFLSVRDLRAGLAPKLPARCFRMCSGRWPRSLGSGTGKSTAWRCVGPRRPSSLRVRSACHRPRRTSANSPGCSRPCSTAPTSEFTSRSSSWVVIRSPRSSSSR